MIARMWTCRTPRGMADAFEAHLRATGVAEVEATPGSAGVTVLRRDAGGVVHFVMISLWESMEAVRTFAGDDPDRAWLHPDDARYELDPDLFVSHWRVLAPG